MNLRAIVEEFLAGEDPARFLAEYIENLVEATRDEAYDEGFHDGRLDAGMVLGIPEIVSEERPVVDVVEEL